MLPVVVTPDAEIATRAYLLPLLTSSAEPYAAGVKVQTLVSTARPLVHIRRIGGSSEIPGVDQPRLDVTVYHDNDANRMSLALLCWAYLKAAASDRAGTTGAVVSYVSTLLGPRPMPAPDDPSSRVVMFTVDLLVR